MSFKGLGLVTGDLENCNCNLFTLKPLVAFWEEKSLIFAGLLGPLCVIILITDNPHNRLEQIGEDTVIGGIPYTASFLLARGEVEDPAAYWGPSEVMPAAIQVMQIRNRELGKSPDVEQNWGHRPRGFYRNYRGGPLSISLKKLLGITAGETIARLHLVLAEEINNKQKKPRVRKPGESRFPSPRTVPEAEITKSALDSCDHTITITQVMQEVVMQETQDPKFLEAATHLRRDMQEIRQELKTSLRQSWVGRSFVDAPTAEA